MRRHKYATIASVTLRGSFIYRGNIIGSLAFYTLFIFVFFNLWRAIYGGQTIEGYDLTQTVWYLCLTELIVFGARTNIFSQMSSDIKSGAIAYLLNRPCHYISYQFFTALGNMALNLLCVGSLAIALSLIMVGPLVTFSWATFPAALLVMAAGMALNFFLLMLLGLMAFFWEENLALYLIYQKLVFMLGMFLPVELLPDWLQSIARLLPFSYVAWAPARLMVRFDWELFLQVFPVQLCWIGIGIACCLLVYRKGVRNIQSNGG